MQRDEDKSSALAAENDDPASYPPHSERRATPRALGRTRLGWVSGGGKDKGHVEEHLEEERARTASRDRSAIHPRRVEEAIDIASHLMQRELAGGGWCLVYAEPGRKSLYSQLRDPLRSGSLASEDPAAYLLPCRRPVASAGSWLGWFG
ncbi:hypothetical protein SKAU_G00189420 [Synaphobranchus kaupii]|uniref:Uncharacterized protein n=1 Tax=Synaphobranchus kaupii TaxID=118154 RepID=A0A9Q1FD51_SYNKA|nr:hypothetical protein SKAU_G00189420 [Synaphobranchus kaupii]